MCVCAAGVDKSLRISVNMVTKTLLQYLMLLAPDPDFPELWARILQVLQVTPHRDLYLLHLPPPPPILCWGHRHVLQTLPPPSVPSSSSPPPPLSFVGVTEAAQTSPADTPTSICALARVSQGVLFACYLHAFLQVLPRSQPYLCCDKGNTNVKTQPSLTSLSIVTLTQAC